MKRIPPIWHDSTASTTTVKQAIHFGMTGSPGVRKNVLDLGLCPEGMEGPGFAIRTAKTCLWSVVVTVCAMGPLNGFTDLRRLSPSRGRPRLSKRRLVRSPHHRSGQTQTCSAIVSLFWLSFAQLCANASLSGVVDNEEGANAETGAFVTDLSRGFRHHSIR